MPARLQPTLSYWPRPPHLASAKLDGRSRVRRNNYCRDAQQKAYNRDCMRSPIHGGNQDGVPLKSQWHPGYRFGKTATERDRRAREDYVRLGRMAVLLFEAALCVVRPITPRRIFVPLLLLLLLGASPARGVDLVDLTLYGGAFDSSSTIAYSEVCRWVVCTACWVQPDTAVVEGTQEHLHTVCSTKKTGARLERMEVLVHMCSSITAVMYDIHLLVLKVVYEM